MNARKLQASVLAGPANVRFGDMQRLVEAFGFRLLRVSGSHHIYGRPDLIAKVDFRRAEPDRNVRFMHLRDGRCIELDESAELSFDHIVLRSTGGSNPARHTMSLARNDLAGNSMRMPGRDQASFSKSGLPPARLLLVARLKETHIFHLEPD